MQREPKIKSNTERVRERTQRDRVRERTKPFSCHRELRSSKRVRERTHCFDPATDIDLPHAGDAEFSQTITAQTNARTNSHRSRPTPDPAQPVDHRSSHSDYLAKHRLTVSFPNRFTVHTLTSPPTHTRPIHTLTSPVQTIFPIRSLHYIYIYLHIYLLFLFINFFNYPCFIKLCIYGLCI